MPTWTKSPPDDPRGQGLPLIRTPALRSLKAIVTSESLIGTDTHYWGGHTVPCERPECDACAAGIRYDWHGYVSAYNPLDQLHFIFEVTANAAKVFQDYQLVNKTLRCCQFEAYRWRHTKNGRVMIKAERSAMADHALPKAPDVRKVMAVIWRIPIPNVKIELPYGGRPDLSISREGDGQSADPRKYNASRPSVHNPPPPTRNQ